MQKRFLTIQCLANTLSVRTRLKFNVSKKKENIKQAYLHSRRRVRWGWAPQAPTGHPAPSFASGSGKTRASGRPVRSAASSASLWNVGSGTRPEQTQPHTRVRVYHIMWPRKHAIDCWRHFDCTSIFCGERREERQKWRLWKGAAGEGLELLFYE